MAITTGAELATAAANWLARADLTSRIPEFVALFEAKTNRMLRTRDMETKDAAFSVTGEYVAVPTGFLEARTFYHNTAPYETMVPAAPDHQSLYLNSGTAKPLYYSVVGSNFRFAPAPDATYATTLVYYKSLTSVSAGGSAVNWLLTNHPDAYLYGTLLEAAGYLGADPRIQLWADALNRVMGDIKRSDNKGRWAGSSMAARPG